MKKNNTNLIDKKQKALNTRINHAKKVQELRAVQANTAKLDDTTAHHWFNIGKDGFTMVLIAWGSITIIIDPSKLGIVANVFKLIASLITKM